MTVRRGHSPLVPRSRAPAELAARSLLIPGLGQFAQGRVGAGLWQLATVLGYLMVAWGFGATRGLWLAVAWNVVSAIDAYVSERTSSID